MRQNFLVSSRIVLVSDDVFMQVRFAGRYYRAYPVKTALLTERYKTR